MQKHLKTTYLKSEPVQSKSSEVKQFIVLDLFDGEAWEKDEQVRQNDEYRFTKVNQRTLSFFSLTSLPPTGHGGIKGRKENGFIFRQNGHVLREMIESGRVVAAQILHVVSLQDLIVFANLL